MTAKKQKSGRPTFEPTGEQRRQVEIWALAMAQGEIAKALGISLPTLRKHFRDELDTGPARRRGEMIEALYAEAARGNVSAARTLDGMIERAERAAAESVFVDPPRRRLGKKEQAAFDAQTAGRGSHWGDDLTPPGFEWFDP